MNKQEHLRLLAEQGFLEEQLRSLPSGARLTRMSAETRLRSVQAQISTFAGTTREPARLRMTFRGVPVFGSHGILAEFASKAVGAFNEAVATVGAATRGPLSSMGPIPQKAQFGLMIVGVAEGSFGFELEEVLSPQLDLGLESPTSLAIKKTQELLEASMGNDDDEFADSIASISDADNRALDKIRLFLDILNSGEALCNIYFNDKHTKFTNRSQLSRSIDRLSVSNISIYEEIIDGHIQGFLPESGTLEFFVADKRKVLKCKVPPSVEDRDKINEHLYQTISATFTITRVGGRSRYVLKEIPKFQNR